MMDELFSREGVLRPADIKGYRELVALNSISKSSPRLVSSCLAGSHIRNCRKLTKSKQRIPESAWNYVDFRVC